MSETTDSTPRPVVQLRPKSKGAPPFEPGLPWAQSLARLNAKYPPRRTFLGRNHVHEACRVTVEAPTGEGKSMYGLGAAKAIAEGEDFLNLPAGNAGPVPVLFIDYEMGRQEMKDRLEHFATENLMVVCFDDEELGEDGLYPIDTAKGKKQVKDLITATKAQVLVLDNLYSAVEGSIMGGAGEGAGQAHEEVVPFLRDLSRSRIGTILLCHANDKRELYGDKRLTWQMTARIAIKRLQNSDHLHIEIEERKIRGRSGPGAEVQAIFIDGAWRLAPAFSDGTCVAATEPPKGRGGRGKGRSKPMTEEEKYLAVKALIDRGLGVVAACMTASDNGKKFKWSKTTHYRYEKSRNGAASDD